MRDKLSETLPKITIVTPSFQQSQFLCRTIESVLNQNYPNLEYIIMDGGSSDGSVDIIKKYAERITYWESTKDAGQSDAINKGLTRATGEVVGWLNSDDTFAPGSLHAIGRYYAQHPDAEFLYGHTNLIDAQDRVLRRLFSVPTNFVELLKFNRNIFSQPGTTWRRHLQERIGLLNPDLHYTMDCDFYVRAAKMTHLHFIPCHLANLRIHEQTKSYGAKIHGAKHNFLKEQVDLSRRHGVIEEKASLQSFLFSARRIARIIRRPANWPRFFGCLV